jgi:hypothetical protein
MQSLGKIVAWGELRSCGRGGASSIDDLVRFWGKPKKAKNLLRLAQWFAENADSQWQEYCVAYDAGALRQESRASVRLVTGPRKGI